MGSSPVPSPLGARSSAAPDRTPVAAGQFPSNGKAGFWFGSIFTFTSVMNTSLLVSPLLSANTSFPAGVWGGSRGIWGGSRTGMARCAWAAPWPFPLLPGQESGGEAGCRASPASPQGLGSLLSSDEGLRLWGQWGPHASLVFRRLCSALTRSCSPEVADRAPRALGLVILGFLGGCLPRDSPLRGFRSRIFTGFERL